MFNCLDKITLHYKNKGTTSEHVDNMLVCRHWLGDLGDGLALLQLVHWTLVGRGRLRLLGSKVGVGLSLRDSHSLDVDVYQKVQLSLHGEDLRDTTLGSDFKLKLHQKKPAGSESESVDHWLPASPLSPTVPSCLGPQEAPRWLFWDGPCLWLVSLCQLSDPPFQSGDSKSQTLTDLTQIIYIHS